MITLVLTQEEFDILAQLVEGDESTLPERCWDEPTKSLVWKVRDIANG